MPSKNNQPGRGGSPVPVRPTPRDDWVMRPTGREYRDRKGSGRSEIIRRFVKDGRLVREVVALAAQHGFDPAFTSEALLKQHGTLDGAWRMEPPEGEN